MGAWDPMAKMGSGWVQGERNVGGKQGERAVLHVFFHSRGGLIEGPILGASTK